MSNHSTGWSAPDEQLLTQTLNEQELVRLEEFVWEMTVRLGNRALPPEVVEADSFRIPWPLIPANFRPQGRSVREAYIQAGEPRRARAVYTDEALPAWRKTPGALEWLRGMLAQLEGEAEA